MLVAPAITFKNARFVPSLVKILFDLRALCEKTLLELRSRVLMGQSPASPEDPLSLADKSIFYSDWYYTAIQVLTSIPRFQTRQKLAEHLALPLDRVELAVEFLLRAGLCQESKGRIKMAAKKTYVESSSPLITKHHVNWRLRAIDKLPKRNSSCLFFTCPVSLSGRDATHFRERLEALIKEFYECVDASPEEEAFCLNIDWFQV